MCTNINTSAWMLHRLGRAVPVMVHLYVEDEDLTDPYLIQPDNPLYYNSVYEAADLLWQYNNAISHRVVHMFFDNWVCAKLQIGDHLPTCISKLAKSAGLTHALYSLEALSRNSYVASDSVLVHLIPDAKSHLLALSKEINCHLNEFFLRARYGGEYENNNENAIYFRVSSTGFDWCPVIGDFIEKHDFPSGAKITIERDENSTGSHEVYALNDTNHTKVDHLGIEEYIALKKSSVIEVKDPHWLFTRILSAVNSEQPMLSFKDVRANTERKIKMLERIRYLENSRPELWS
jgi:hypothetical protein